MGNEDGAKRYLTNALTIAPDSGAVQFAYGLMLVRNKRYEESTTHLEKAARAVDASPRFAFVYGVSLWQLKQPEKALTVLDDAAARWPGDYDLLTTRAKYAYLSKNAVMLHKAVTALGKVYPQDSVYLQLKPLIQP